MKPLNQPNKLQELRTKIKIFKDQKWGMKNFFKIEESEYEEFKKEIDDIYFDYIEVNSVSEKNEKIKEIVDTLKKSAEEVRNKTAKTNGTGLKLHLRDFDTAIQEFQLKPKNRY